MTTDEEGIKPPWIEVNIPAAITKNGSIFLELNDHEFVIITSTGIYKYSTTNKRWRLWITYPTKLSIGVWQDCVAINKEKSMIYIHNHDKNIISFDIKSKKFQVHKSNIEQNTGSLICIDNELHFIGGYYESIQYKYDFSKDQFQELHYFGAEANTHFEYLSTKLIWLPKAKEVLVLGARDMSSRYSDATQILTYSPLTFTLYCIGSGPRAVDYSDAVVTKDEKLVIIIRCCYNDIHIYDFDSAEMRKTQVRLDYVLMVVRF